MKYSTLFLILPLMLVNLACAQQTDEEREWKPEDTEYYEPVPPKVEVGGFFMEAPSDATVLFDGSDFSAWESVDGGDVEWTLDNSAMTVKPGTGNIATKEKFGSIQLYIEWRSPSVVKGEGQGRGNSGVFLQQRYEVQVLDAYNNETYVNGMAGSIYKQYIPYVNAARKPGEWQSYNIIFEAPEFDDAGNLVKPAYITLFWNGVLVQHKSELKGPTEYIGLPKYVAHGDDSIVLQDHGNPVSYRNIWIRKLDDSPVRMQK